MFSDESWEEIRKNTTKINSKLRAIKEAPQTRKYPKYNLDHNFYPSLEPAHKKKNSKEIYDILDLHGYTIDNAYKMLEIFFASNSGRLVLIITGKGTEDQTTIRSSFIRWLEYSLLKNYVKNYEIAKKEHGGTGAFYIWLK